MGRHALLEARDVTSETHPHPVAEVRTVAEIVAEFRREQAVTAATADGVPPTSPGAHAPADVTPATAPTVDAAADPAAADTPDDDTPDDDTPDDDTPDDDTPEPDATPEPAGTVRTDELTRRDAAWHAALRPSGTTPARRRRATGAGSASSVIASMTAELSVTHPGLLDGTPHSRRAAAPARRTTAAGSAATLRPVRVTGGLRGAALRVPALTGGWTLPTRTPLVLAGAVAVAVVVTDQTGLLSTTTGPQTHTAASRTDLVAGTATTTADGDAARGAAEARTRVSRLERATLSPSTAPAAVTNGATTAGSGTAIAAAPPPDSVMKPGQTIPGNWIRPTATGIYNSCFCARWGTFHEGIDFAAPLGSPILAVGDGVVVQAGPASGFGNWVIIKHDDGDMTIYGHMRYFYVKVGQRVTAGQEIALVGAEGEATGPHLHLGIKVGSTNGIDGTYADPVAWLTARGVAVGPYNQNG